MKHRYSITKEQENNTWVTAQIITTYTILNNAKPLEIFQPLDDLGLDAVSTIQTYSLILCEIIAALSGRQQLLELVQATYQQNKKTFIEINDRDKLALVMTMVKAVIERGYISKKLLNEAAEYIQNVLKSHTNSVNKNIKFSADFRRLYVIGSGVMFNEKTPKLFNKGGG